MKSKYSLTAITALGFATPLFAIERPVPAELPKEQGKKPIDMPIAQAKPFLGIFGTGITKELSDMHNLKGVGIQLRMVAPGSAAEKAGLKAGDILKSIDGKNITEQDDVKAQLTGKKPGDKIKVAIISGAENKELEIELGKAPKMLQAAPMPKALDDGAQGLEANGIPKELLKQIPEEHRKKLMELMKDKLGEGFEGGPLGKAPEMFMLPPQRLELNMQDLQGGGGANFRSTTKMMDEEGSITLETNGKKKSVELHDKEGKLLFKGPYTTEEDKKKVPEKFRKRLERLNAGGIIGPNAKGEAKGGALQVKPEDLLKGLKDIPQLKGKEMKELGNQIQKQLNLRINGAQLKLNGKNVPLNGNMMQGGVFRLQMGPNGKMQVVPPGGAVGGDELQAKDKDGLLKMRQTPDGKQVELYDTKGELLFSGAYESDFDKASLPEEYRKRIEDSGLEKRLGQANPFGDPFGDMEGFIQPRRIVPAKPAQPAKPEKPQENKKEEKQPAKKK